MLTHDGFVSSLTISELNNEPHSVTVEAILEHCVKPLIDLKCYVIDHEDFQRLFVAGAVGMNCFLKLTKAFRSLRLS